MEMQNAPVKVGDEIDVHIESVGGKGDGMARVKGFVLFVPNTESGKDYRVRITKVLSKVGFAEVVAESSAPAETREPEPEEPEFEDTEDFGEE